jgi:hypothetical protein
MPLRAHYKRDVHEPGEGPLPADGILRFEIFTSNFSFDYTGQPVCGVLQGERRALTGTRGCWKRNT